MTTVFPVILSGGSGTRLWPLSRAMYPKQFIRFFNDQPLSFLGATVKRLAPSLGFAAPTLLCNNDHRFLVADDLAQAGVKARAIILEPVARNTAAAIAVAALSARADDPAAVIVVMPSDHAITDGAKFAEAVARAAVVAATGKLVLFGITPDVPETGYGYIRKGGPIAGAAAGAFAVAAFVEKPNLATAEQYLASGEYFWNSGPRSDRRPRYGVGKDDKYRARDSRKRNDQAVVAADAQANQMRHDQADISNRTARRYCRTNDEARRSKNEHSNSSDLDSKIKGITLADHHQIQRSGLRSQHNRSNYYRRETQINTIPCCLRQITQQPERKAPQFCRIEQCCEHNDHRRQKRRDDHARQHEAFDVHAHSALGHSINGDRRQTRTRKGQQRTS